MVFGRAVRLRQGGVRSDRPPRSGRPLDQLLVLFQARALVLGGGEDLFQPGCVDVEPRQGIARFHEKPVLLR